MRGKRTTIQVLEETKEELRKLKIHPREPYDDVIKRLISKWRGQTHS